VSVDAAASRVAADTAASSVPAKVPNGVPMLFGLVFAVWVAGFLLLATGREPFPALTMPGFGYIADNGDAVDWADVRYVVSFADGRTQTVDYHDVLPEVGAKADSIAATIFENADPETIAWLVQRLDALDLDGRPVRLTVRVVKIELDRHTFAATEVGTKDIVVVELEGR
jgi:hypothetical protein